VSLLRADLAPLRASRDFRLLYVSRTVTLFGTLAADVALLVQARQLTGSTFDVGLLGAAELVPVVVFGLYGGVLADRLDRSRLPRLCEAGLGCCAGLLVINALQPRPAVWPLYLIAAAASALAALQRPSLDASVPRIVARHQLTAAAALMAMSSNASFIAGSAFGGALAAGYGPGLVYGFDTVSFAVSLGFLCLLRPLPAAATGEHPAAPGLRSVLAGLRYARGRPELLGSYLADLAAMGSLIPMCCSLSWPPSCTQPGRSA
jgi:MFS family permease